MPMTERPAPPVPPECVLRGHDYFPLYFERLRKSKWWRRASDTARARNVMMWGEAYKAQPAGSLPDDDDELAEAAGYGMNVEAFLAVKDEIMAPWMLCADGRWYHPTTCEVVLEVWGKTSAKRRDDARRKRDQRDRARGVTPQNENVTRDTNENDRDYHVENEPSATREEKRGENPPNPPHGGADEDRAFERALAAYPEAGRKNAPIAASRAEWDRQRAEGATAETLVGASEAIGTKPPDKPKRFDRWLRDGLWRHYAPTEGRAPYVSAWTGPADLRAAIVARMGEPWAVSWLYQARFQEVPARALMVPRALVCERLMREVGDVLEEFRVQIVVQESAA